MHYSVSVGHFILYFRCKRIQEFLENGQLMVNFEDTKCLTEHHGPWLHTSCARQHQMPCLFVCTWMLRDLRGCLDDPHAVMKPMPGANML